MMWEYFTDPVLRAPTLGSMLMCLGASLVGVLAFLRKSSLIGETLSHAAYPGVMLGAISASFISSGDPSETSLAWHYMIGAFITALVAMWVLLFLQKRLKISSDAALCFVLALFFGLGIVVASRLQFTQSTLYTQSLTYLYGQVATMNDTHILIYGILAIFIAAMVIMLYKELALIAFDKEYAASLGISIRLIDFILFFMIALSIVVGIRSVGVVMMSAMLIAPAVAARQWTDSLHKMLIIAALIGALSAFFGTFFSVEGSVLLKQLYPNARVSLATGPIIVLVAGFLAIVSLIFSPKRGIVPRMVRKWVFQVQCLSENLLKSLWKSGEGVSLSEIKQLHHTSPFLLKGILKKLEYNGWVQKAGKSQWVLTEDGKKKAAKIVRLHRLWELYLADHLGIGVDRVHRSAEQMEHILTPEIEKELQLLLKDPRFDPHNQPIPGGGV